MKTFNWDVRVGDSTGKAIGDVTMSDNTRRTSHYASSNDNAGIGYLAGQAAASQQENRSKRFDLGDYTTGSQQENKSKRFYLGDYTTGSQQENKSKRFYLGDYTTGSQQENRKEQSDSQQENRSKRFDKQQEKTRRKREDTSSNRSCLLLSHRRPAEYNIGFNNERHERQLAKTQAPDSM